MLQLHPHQRLCMADLIGHPWLSGEIATAEEVRAEFARRQEVCKAKKKQAAIQNATRPANKKAIRRDVQFGEKIFTCGELTAEEAKNENKYVQIKMKQIDSDMTDKTVFFVYLDVGSILSEIEKHVIEKGTNF